MKEFSLGEIKQKYLEYKDILNQIKNGNYDLRDERGHPYTIAQIEMMHEIVKTLDDMGFEYLVREVN